jgi:hypothetical protein
MIFGKDTEREAAQKAAECDQQSDNDQSRDWRRIQAANKEMHGPHED